MESLSGKGSESEATICGLKVNIILFIYKKTSIINKQFVIASNSHIKKYLINDYQFVIFFNNSVIHFIFFEHL